MANVEVIGFVSLICNLLVLLITTLISLKIANLRTLMFERFITRDEFYAMQFHKRKEAES